MNDRLPRYLPAALTSLAAALPATPAVKGPTADSDPFRGFPASGQTTAYTADKNGAPGSAVPDDGTVESGSARQRTCYGERTDRCCLHSSWSGWRRCRACDTVRGHP